MRTVVGTIGVAILVASCGGDGGDGGDGGVSTGTDDAVVAADSTSLDDAVGVGPDAGADLGAPDDPDTATAPDVATAEDIVADTEPDEPAPPAPPPPLVDPTSLEPDTGGLAIQPDLALGPGGDLAVVFTRPDPDESLGIGFLLLDADSATVAGPLALNTSAAGGQNEPSVCALASGGYVATWSSDVGAAPGPDGATLHVRFRRVDAAGAPLDAEDVRVLTGVPGNHWLARLACRPGGGFVVTGVRPDPDGTFGVFAQAFGDDGVAEGEAVTLHTAGSGDQVFPFVGAGGGAIVAAWEDDGHEEGDLDRVVTRRWTAEGLEDPVVAHGTSTTAATLTAVSVDPVSGAAMVGGVLAQATLELAWLAAGAAPAPISLGDEAGAPTYHPALAAYGDERHAVAWLAGVGADVSVRLGTVGPVVLEDGPLVLASSDVAAYRPAVATRDGRLVVGWTVKSETTQFALRLAVLAP